MTCGPHSPSTRQWRELIDSRGDVYVAEVTYTFAGKAGLVPEGTHTLQKVELVGH